MSSLPAVPWLPAAASGAGAGAELPPVASTGVGSWPGTDMADAIKIAFAECPEFPYLPELPARGVHAGMIGHATAFLADLAVDLQPAGWRLTDGSGRDHRLAIGLVRRDLDVLEELAQDYSGPLKIAVTGPWTLAASVERPRGDRVLADHGGRRELGQSLAEGTATLLAEVRRRLPAVTPVLQLDEPLLPAVMAGAVPTASGFSRHRVIDLPELSRALTGVIERVREVAGVDTVVHCCAADAPLDLLRRAGASALFVDLDLLTTEQWDVVGAALEDGMWLGAGAVAAGTAPTADQIARRVLSPVRALGLDPTIAARLVLTPACGLASASSDGGIRTLRTLRTAAGLVTEQLAD